MKSAKTFALNLLEGADVKIGGSRPWDIQIHNERFFARVLSDGTLGLGESYMEGWWDCGALDQLFFHLMTADVQGRIRPSFALVTSYLRARIFNRQALRRAFHVGEKHYDLGNSLYEAMLDKRLNYSCAYWEGAKNLDEAQERKLEMLCRKLRLEPGTTVLDIGCGWGGFAGYAAEKYGARVVGITVSQEQAQYVRARYGRLPVEVRIQDYRQVTEKFDRIVSVGMFEHVGYKNYRNYMKVAARCLKDAGLFLLHTIGSNRTSHTGDPWFDRYIFPNGMLPSAAHIASSSEGLFRMEDWHNIGPHYDSTLMAWHSNFQKNRQTFEKSYGSEFCRMWDYYLLLSAGCFRARTFQLWQVVFSPIRSCRTYERPSMDR
jgi:cyclopropane-fatty-acyl-phospholipid synthase